MSKAVYISDENVEKLKEKLDDIAYFDWSTKRGTKRNANDWTVAEQFSYLCGQAEDIIDLLNKCQRRVINGRSQARN